MDTYKAIIGRLRADGTYAVRIRITQQKQLAYIPTDIYVDQKYIRNSKKSGLAIHDYRVLDKIDTLIRRYMRICNESDLRGLDAKGVAAFVKVPRRGTSLRRTLEFHHLQILQNPVFFPSFIGISSINTYICRKL